MPRRIDSIFDQGVWSAISFGQFWLVARFTSPDTTAVYVLLFGIGLLLLRPYTAVVTMPLTTTKSLTGAHGQKARSLYHMLHMVTVLVLCFLALLLASIVVGAGVMPASSIFWPAIVLPFYLSQEYVRRYLMLFGTVIQSLAFGICYGLLLIIGIAVMVTRPGANGFQLFEGYVAAVIAANIVFGVIAAKDGMEKLSARILVLQVRRHFGLLVNNIVQWANGQGAYYILLLTSGSAAIASFAVLRNIFGPLNVFLLSLEGFLPRRLADAQTIEGDRHSVGYHVQRETMVVTIGAVIVAIGAYLWGVDLLHAIYGWRNTEPLGRASVLGFTLIYYFLFVTRIFISALRAFDQAGRTGAISIVGLFVLVGAGCIASTYWSVDGMVLSMVLSEMVMAFLFLRNYREASRTSGRAETKKQ